MINAKPLNITPKRLEALRFLASRPNGVRVAMLAHEVLVRYSCSMPIRIIPYSSQQATRTGAGCAVPLIKAGLISKRDRTFGWGDVKITSAGLQLLAELDKPAEVSLDSVLKRCTAAETEGAP